MVIYSMTSVWVTDKHSSVLRERFVARWAGSLGRMTRTFAMENRESEVKTRLGRFAWPKTTTLVEPGHRERRDLRLLQAVMSILSC